MTLRRLATRFHLFTLVPIAVVALVCAAAAEKIVRVYRPDLMPAAWQSLYFATHVSYPVSPDRDVGYVRPPHRRESIATHDYTISVQYDGHGFPNDEPWPDRAEIVFLGDSLVEGQGVVPHDNFTYLVPQMLHVRGVNLGMAASGPLRQYHIYRKFGAPLHPCVVVAGLYLTSDFDNDVSFTRWVDTHSTENFEAYSLRYAREQTNVRKPLLTRIVEKSWFLGTAREWAMRIVQGGDYISDHRRFADGSEILLNRQNLAFARPPAAPDDPRIEPLVAALRKLRELARSENTAVAVLLIPSKEEVYCPAGKCSADNIVARTRQRLQQERFTVLDLAGALHNADPTHPLYFPQDLHLNPPGHRVVATAVADWLQGTIPALHCAG